MVFLINSCENITTFALDKVTPVVDVSIADLKLGEDAAVTYPALLMSKS